MSLILSFLIFSTSEEFLLSAGNVLSRSQLRSCLKNVQSLHHEFWEIPLNHPEKSAVTGCGTKNRYRSILPNERTRVKLASDGDNPLDAYINANYIKVTGNQSSLCTLMFYRVFNIEIFIGLR